MHRIDQIRRRPRIGRRPALYAFVTGVALANLAGALPASGSRSDFGRAARAEALDEQSHLRLTYVKGNRIAGEGRASGTIAGGGSARLTLVSADRAVGEFRGRDASGSVSGGISASYRVAGATSYFTGSVTGLRGTGKYARARSLGIRFSGTLDRPKLTLAISAVGHWQR